MNLILSAVATQGIGMLAGGSANRKAKRAEEASGMAQAFQNAIDLEKDRGELALQNYNDEIDLTALESEQTAMSGAMGKRSTSASLVNIQKQARTSLASNVARNKATFDRSKKFAQASQSGRRRASNANAKSRNVNTYTSGLMNLATSVMG